MKNAIVVARYSENLDWVNLIDKNKYEIYIYNKGNKLNDIHNYELPNFGRESQTYIHHIIKNYDNLPNFVMFLQGDPFDHCGNITNYDYDDLIKFINEYEFENDLTLISGIHSDLGHMGEKKILKDEFNLNDSINFFPVGAQFMVRKELILNKPYDFWKSLYNLSSPNNKMCYITLPYVLERLWVNIFYTEIK
jgi:hypothetical protein